MARRNPFALREPLFAAVHHATVRKVARHPVAGTRGQSALEVFQIVEQRRAVRALQRRVVQVEGHAPSSPTVVSSISNRNVGDQSSSTTRSPLAASWAA